MTVRRIKKTLPSGKSMVRWVADVDFQHPDGRRERVRKTPRVQTRVGAERLEREIRSKFELPQQNTSATRVVPTLHTFWLEFLANHVRVNNKPSEQAAKMSIMRHHLLPAFGELRLHEITQKRVESYKALKLNGPPAYARKTINNHLAVLKTVLYTAKEWEELEAVPKFRDLRLPEHKTYFLTFKQSARLIACSDERWQPMVTLALHTGLRIGEILALEWSDISLESGRLMVNRSDWKGIIGLPKGGRGREIPLNTTVIASLEQARHNRSHLVFCTPLGKRLTQAMCRRPLHRICVAAGVSLLQWHALRHTFASHLVMRGVSLRAVQMLLGHANYSTTERYAHLTPDISKSAVKLLEAP